MDQPPGRDGGTDDAGLRRRQSRRAESDTDADDAREEAAAFGRVRRLADAVDHALRRRRGADDAAEAKDGEAVPPIPH